MRSCESFPGQRGCASGLRGVKKSAGTHISLSIPAELIRLNIQ
jgi:hypothetical protein